MSNVEREGTLDRRGGSMVQVVTQSDILRSLTARIHTPTLESARSATL